MEKKVEVRFSGLYQCTSPEISAGSETGLIIIYCREQGCNRVLSLRVKSTESILNDGGTIENWNNFSAGENFVVTPSIVTVTS